ncbi:MAG: AraC family transcriptional regulator [Aquabacterium sp.]|nr:AraC family transcriptional regulator [Aquabacterium sp.]
MTTVPIDFVRQLLDRPNLDEHTQRACLTHAGIPFDLLASPQARATTEQFAALYRLVAVRTQDESPGMFSRPLKPGTLKFLALSVVQARTLMIALYRLTQFFRLVLDDLHFDLRSSENRVSIVLMPQTSVVSEQRFTQEVMLKLVHGIASWLAGQKIPLAGIDLAFSPPTYATDYVYLYPGPAQFNKDLSAIHFDRHWLEGPVRQHAGTIRSFLSRAPADWMFVSFAERLVSHRVRQHLDVRLVSTIHIDDVAKALLMSSRTLTRRLDEEGTSFQVIKDELRRDVAIQLLAQSTLPPQEIGARVGFEDPTTFYRAFKRWTGCSPGVYRQVRVKN